MFALFHGRVCVCLHVCTIHNMQRMREGNTDSAEQLGHNSSSLQSQGVEDENTMLCFIRERTNPGDETL